MEFMAILKLQYTRDMRIPRQYGCANMHAVVNYTSELSVDPVA